MVWVPTPAARTLAALQQDIGNYITAPVDASLAAVIVTYLNDGIDRLATQERWPWLLASENVTLVTGTSAYELVTGATKKVRHIHLLDTSDKEKSALIYKDPKTFAIEHPDRSQNGDPTVYTTFNIIADGKVDLNVPPSAAFIQAYPKMKVRVQKRLQHFFSTSTSDTITTLGGGPMEVESFLSWHAKALAAMGNGFTDRVDFARRRADEMWMNLIADRNREADFD